METSTILTILATALITGLGVYFTIRRRYTGQITFVKEDSIGLFDSIVKNLPELAVLYGDNPVSQGLVLLKGFLLNTGAKDITESMVEERISFKLPERFQWLTGRIVSTSPNIQANLTVERRDLTFQTGLFRCNEHIHFEALAEVPIEEGKTATENPDMGKRLEEALEFSHRIADTQKIKTRELHDTPLSTKKMRKNLIILGFGVAVLVTTILLVYFKVLPAKINYLVAMGSDKTIEVRISPRADGTVKVRGVGHPYKEIFTADEFFSQKDLKPKVVYDPFPKYFYITAIIAYVIIPLIICLSHYIDYRKAKKLRRLLSISE